MIRGSCRQFLSRIPSARCPGPAVMAELVGCRRFVGARSVRGDGKGKPFPLKGGLGGLEGVAFEAAKQFQPHS